MKYILDTHILLWWLNDDKKLDSNKKKIIANPNNLIFISAVNIWEIEIKKALGKLVIPESYIKTCIETQFTELPITISHISYLAKLDNHHSDPFDRLLICQSIAENCILITEDKILKSYDIHCL